MAAATGGVDGLMAHVIELHWATSVEKWQRTAVNGILERLQDQARDHFPALGMVWPPDTGKPRHARRIGWIEPWLQDALEEIDRFVLLVKPPAEAPRPAVEATRSSRDLMEAAIQEMQLSVKDQDRPLPLVGAVVLLPDGSIVGAHRSQFRNGDHAEYTLFERHLRSMALDDARLYVTLEPCAPGARSREKTACAERVVNARVREVWIGMPDPYPSVNGMGRRYLEEHGIAVRDFDVDLGARIREANAEFLEFAEAARENGAGPA